MESEGPRVVSIKLNARVTRSPMRQGAYHLLMKLQPAGRSFSLSEAVLEV